MYIGPHILLLVIIIGTEISKDLVQLLQKKLDDGVLDILSDILTRNPKCKLTIEDVQVSIKNCTYIKS